jgi:ATP-dependent helicase/nuclease subunit A
MTSDSVERAQALDIRHSFIVRAPAGSGKTQLLTLRFLALLAVVQKDPEEVLAITFTRKAVTEMRARILNILLEAKDPTKIDSLPEQTRALAQAVLDRDARENWNLLENPNRLRIQTIDAFCGYLVRQMPIALNHFGSFKVSDDSVFLYRKAARETLKEIDYAEDWSAPIEQLLLHLDNAYDKVEQLLVDMLARRDQWLPYLTHFQTIERRQLEEGLAQIICEHLQLLAKKFPRAYLFQLIPLLRYAAAHLNVDHPLQIFLSTENFPTDSLDAYPCWLVIAQFLLTKEKKWKKTFTQRDGFSASKESVAKDMKRKALDLLQLLSIDENLRILLADLTFLPSPQYSDQQWEAITAWLKILPVLLAHLKLLFEREKVVDYVEIALNAQTALDEIDTPSDLALQLEHQIRHILVDEFQDTSFSQWRLLEKLTAGWQLGDGKTLFLVGDPMQSIYRFRKAEVGIFLRAWKQGIHAISLKPLTLSMNFRSQAKLVNWVGELFTQVMSSEEDVRSGAIQFSSSVPVHPAYNACSVEWYPIFNADEQREAVQMITILQRLFTVNPKESIAILVKSRSHVQMLLPLLRMAKISYRAMELERLSDHPAIADLMGLTRAFLNPLDRIAWLAILRAPWCGLQLSDLYQIAGIDCEKIIWEKIVTFQQLKLSEDGKLRIAHFLKVMQKNLDERGSLSLSDTIEKIWHELNGPACLSSFNDLKIVNAFFALLDEISTVDDILDFEQLENRLSQLYADATFISDSPVVEIMTIHKAKGLEFDHVILPALARRTAQDDAKLLLWSEYMSPKEQSYLVLGPIKNAYSEADPMYQYLKRQESEKARHEMLRLFYVAVTRAKKSLHLLGSVNYQAEGLLKKPSSQSVLGQIWPYVKNVFEEALSTSEICLDEVEENLRLQGTDVVQERFLRRLKKDFFN